MNKDFELNNEQENNLDFDGNFNRIDTRHTPETRGGILQGNSEALFNMFLRSHLEILKKHRLEDYLKYKNKVFNV